MTQVHICFTSINNLLGESNMHNLTSFISSDILTSPYCFVDCSSFLSAAENRSEMSPIGLNSSSPPMSQKISVEFNNPGMKKMTQIEPDISVDVKSNYAISFRDQQDQSSNFQRPFRP